MILTNCSRIWRLWLGHLPVPTADRCISTVSRRVNFRLSRRFAKSASTRIRSPPSTTSWDTGALRSSRSRGPTNITGKSSSSGNDSAFNSMNPFAGEEQPYYSTQFNGNVGGPIGKTASFFFNVERRNINELTAVNAFVLDPTLAPVHVGRIDS